MSTAKQRMTQSRIMMMIKSPFLSTILMSLKFVEAHEIHMRDPKTGQTIVQPLPTAGTDGTHYFFNPDFVDKLSVDELVFLHAHESMHVAFQHMIRAGSRDPRMFNQAADYVINLVLTDMGFTMPQGGLLSEHFRNLSTEQIYEKLEQDPNGAGGGQSGGGNGDFGQDIVYANGDDKELAGKIQRTVAQAKNNSAMQKEFGNLPGALREMIDDILQPKLPWKVVMRNFLTDRVRGGSTWSKPNRRYSDCYLPARYTDGLKDIVIAVDTSGSIDMELLKEFFGEINGIREELHPELVTVIYCDAAINKVVEVAKGESLIAERVGGGGTNFIPVFEYIKDKKLNPKALLYFTDMDGTFPDRSEFPTLWLKYGGYGFEPPFGQVVNID